MKVAKEKKTNRIHVRRGAYQGDTINHLLFIVVSASVKDFAKDLVTKVRVK